uniref:Beta-lactamase domain-containing protein n=1 Tax=Syphacia muris TaxID=451379 RepID=A0A158R4A8_9BILA
MIRHSLISTAALGTALSVFKFNGVNIDSDENSSIKRRKRAVELVERFMQRNGVPGLSVGVSVNGETVWHTGFGYSDVEQLVKCTENTVMRIASISKSITATVVARLVESGKLDLDKPIQKYLSNYPVKRYKGIPVDITSRQLLCHTAGIRHYKEEQKPHEGHLCDKQPNEVTKKNGEFYSNKHYESVEAALQTFINDELVAKPGEEFNYTTNGYTLLSAVTESVTGQSFRTQLQSLLLELGMNHTRLDSNDDIIPNRTRYYFRDEHGVLKNSSEVDNSNKWAGGGIISTVDDLLVFGNVMLYRLFTASFRPYNACCRSNHQYSKPLIGAETLRTFWKGEITAKESKNYMYALGWYKKDDSNQIIYGGCDNAHRHFGYWMHTGGAVGASSVLLIKPNDQEHAGLCVAVLTNLENCKGLTTLALELGDIFYPH